MTGPPGHSLMWEPGRVVPEVGGRVPCSLERGLGENERLTRPVCLWPGARPGVGPQRGHPRLQLPGVVLLGSGHSIRRVSS